MFNVWQNLQSAVFLYFTKLFAVIHSLTDCICFRTALAAMNCAYTVLQCIWQIFLFKAYCNFKEAYAAIQLSGTAIISGSHLQGPVFIALVIVSVFKDIELIRLQLQPSIRRMAFFYFPNSFKFTAFFHNRRNCSKEIS